MKAHTLVQIVLTAFSAGTLIFSSCSGSPDISADESRKSDEEVSRETVRVSEISYMDISRTLTNTANLEAYREVYLAPAQPGRIDRIYAETGDKVTAGQILVEMDKTQLNQALVQLKSLETDYRRLDTLRQAGSIPQQQYDQMKTQYDLLVSNVQFLHENTWLVAPFNGKVSAKYYENGEMFSGAPNTPAGKAAIITLVQTNQLKTLVSISERFYPSIKQGMTVSLRTDVYPGETFEGKISRIYPTIDPGSRTFKVELIVPNPDERLRPGMFARAETEIDKVRALVVPALAILKLQGSNERYIFIEENGRAKRVVVEPGDRYDDMVEIIANGIKEGDRLIVAGQARLLDGTEVVVSREL